MNNEALLSIVVPAYNVEKYINECIDSLINQSLINHKIIIVNDGSKDNTGSICEGYAKKYPDLITYVYQENKGLGAARNTGMKYVETPLVTFLDSDDWHGELFVEKTTNLIKKLDFLPDVIVMLPWIYDTVSNQYLDWHSKDAFERIFSNEDEDDEEIKVLTTKTNPELLSLEVSANSKIYRSEFLKKMEFQFPEGVRWEDIRPHFQILTSAKSIVALKDAGFYYRFNMSGQITAENGKTRMDSVTVFRDALDYANKLRFTDDEYSYLLRWICNYTKWNLDMVNKEYRLPLLEEFHKLYKDIPMYRFKKYLNTCSPKRRKEYLMIKLLKSPFYKLLKDYWLKEYVVEKLEKIVKR